MDIKKLNIWKTVEKINHNEDSLLNADITELCLGVRSFNCLKRAGCNTIKDVLDYMGEDGQGLRKVRNLGSRSETEILEKIQEFKESCDEKGVSTVPKKVTVIKPAKRVWEREIEEFQLSNYALTRLKACDIHTVGDLYATNPKKEPGWYAVRELFGKLPSAR